MGSVRWSVDPRATTRLRFDDEAFVAALRADGDTDEHPLARLIGVDVAADVDLTPYIEDGVYIDARLGLTGAEADRLMNLAQQQDARQGVRVDVAGHNRAWFALWAVGVGDERTENGDVSDIPAKLSSPDRKQREEAFGQLAVVTRNVLAARLRVHVDAQQRPAMRDPKPSRPAVEDSDS